MGEGHLWRLSVTLCLKPAGGLTCHSASSFCRRLHAILLRACTRAPMRTHTNGEHTKISQIERRPRTRLDRMWAIGRGSRVCLLPCETGTRRRRTGSPCRAGVAAEAEYGERRGKVSVRRARLCGRSVRGSGRCVVLAGGGAAAPREMGGIALQFSGPSRFGLQLYKVYSFLKDFFFEKVCFSFL